jgi:LytTr DNA-binding domain
MSCAPSEFLPVYLRWRRPIEIAAWIAIFAISAAANTAVATLDIQREHLAFESWEPFTWEWTSNLTMLCLVPLIVLAERRMPLRFGRLRLHLAGHALVSVAISIAHVVIMVALRKMAYGAMGRHYDFGPLPLEFFYEYLKDARAYALIVAMVSFYRQLLLRMQGEASLLDAPEDEPPGEAAEKPQRFLVKKMGKEFVLPANDIEWIQAWGNYVNLRVRAHDYPMRSTMAAIEARLDGSRFVRVHRSYIVNLDHVAQIEPSDSGDATVRMKDQAPVPCSRRYRDALKRVAAT